MTSTAYVVARLADTESLVPAIDTLSKADGILRWDAVEGSAHLLVKVALAGLELPPALHTLEGVAAMHRYDIERDDESGAPRDVEACHGYMYIDTDPEAREALRTALKKDERVVFCSDTFGECDLVALVKGGTFEDIASFIDREVLGLDGILRLKHDWVINLTTL